VQTGAVQPGRPNAKPCGGPHFQRHLSAAGLKGSMPQQRGDLATMGRLRRASMKSFLGLCEINLKQMTDLLGLLAYFHMGVCL